MRKKFVSDSLAKAKQDSATTALAEKRAAADSLAKAKTLAALEAKKLAVVNDKDYPEGLTEETKTEGNKTIYRTVIKKKDSSTIFQKVVYGWGGLYYFIDNTIISGTTYDAEIKKAKDTLEKYKGNK